jgi:hypothetical protein
MGLPPFLETLTYCTDDDPWMIGTAKVRDDRVAGIPLFDVQKCPGGQGPAGVKNWMTPGKRIACFSLNKKKSWSHDQWLGVKQETKKHRFANEGRVSVALHADDKTAVKHVMLFCLDAESPVSPLKNTDLMLINVK